MKNVFLYTVLFIILILSSLYIYIKSVIDTLEFKVQLDNLNLGNLSSESLKKDNSFVTIKLLFIIRFFGLFNISISELNIKSFYKGKLIASSANDVENFKKITLVNGKVNNIYHAFDVQLNTNTAELILLIQSKKSFTIDYELSFKILGLTIKYKGKYE